MLGAFLGGGDGQGARRFHMAHRAPSTVPVGPGSCFAIRAVHCDQVPVPVGFALSGQRDEGNVSGLGLRVPDFQLMREGGVCHFIV